jgi:hypothetical protein
VRGTGGATLAAAALLPALAALERESGSHRGRRAILDANVPLPVQNRGLDHFGAVRPAFGGSHAERSGGREVDKRQHAGVRMHRQYTWLPAAVG